MTDTTLLDTPLSQDAQRPAVPKFDPAKYAPHTEDFDMTEAQQEEYLRTLWSIMAAFVDLGFGVDSVQRVLPVFQESASGTLENAVKQIQQIPIQEFNEAASPEAPEDSNHDG